MAEPEEAPAGPGAQDTFSGIGGTRNSLMNMLQAADAARTRNLRRDRPAFFLNLPARRANFQNVCSTDA